MSLFNNKAYGALRFILLIVTSVVYVSADAQQYSLAKILDEKIQVVHTPVAETIQEKSDARKGSDGKELSDEDAYDTTFVNYKGKNIDFKMYTIHNPEYTVLNPEPTGILINGQYYDYYCNVERSLPKHLTSFFDIYEFNFLGKNYLALVALREDCLTKGCRYKCFNFFDITDPDKVIPYSFSSIYAGKESFGDYNKDGLIDFIRIAPKKPKSYLEDEKDTDPKSNTLITAYTIKSGEAKRLEKEMGNPYYMYVNPTDEEVTGFSIIQHDWFDFFPLNDPEGNKVEAKAYFPPYTAFDPINPFLYNKKGNRVDMKEWVILMAEFPELDGALELCELMEEMNFKEAYIKVSQYNRELTYRVLYGNYWGRDKVEKLLRKIRKNPELSMQTEAGEIKRIKDFDF